MKAALRDTIRGCIIAVSARIQGRRILRFALGPLAFSVASVCAGQSRVFDTGYEIARGQASSLYWIDNERLLFAGTFTADMEAAIRNKDANRGRLKKLYLWNASTRVATLYADAKDVCVADGAVHYTVRIDESAGKIVERVGPIGSEKDIEKPLAPKGELSRGAQTVWVRSKHTCRIHRLSELIPPPEAGRRIIVLRNGDGYIDAGPLAPKELLDQRNRPIRLFHPNRQSPVELPITIEQGAGNPTYSQYVSAYVSRPRPIGSDPGHITSWPRGLPFTIYTFTSNGLLDKSVIPYGEWGTLAQPLPTRVGWVFSGYGEIRRKAGLFLFDVSSVRRLDTGQVYEIAVSKDGCRVAVGIQNRHLDMGTPINLKVIDLCLGAR
jgi:hypothetical protein